jgi:tripartite-type tricarboxylate transporter receptor subunit TctC
MRAHAVVLLAALAVSTTTPAQDNSSQTYPSRPVRVILPQPAGSGPSDVSARAMAHELEQALHQPFVIENRPGANGIIGAQTVAKAPPDGYTLMITSASVISVNPFMYADVPYDPPKDFAPVIMVGFSHQALVANPRVTAANLRELLEQARARPGAITWGTFGPSSASHLYIEWLKNVKGLQFYNVPYKTAGQALRGAVAGQVDLAVFALGGAVPLVKAGKLKALAIAGDERNPVLPGVPSMKESGIELALRNWYGVFAPVATPRDIVQRLNGAMAKVLGDKKMQAFLESKAGLAIEPPAGGSTGAFAAFLKADRETYRELVKITGAKAQNNGSR